VRAFRGVTESEWLALLGEIIRWGRNCPEEVSLWTAPPRHVQEVRCLPQRLKYFSTRLVKEEVNLEVHINCH